MKELQYSIEIDAPRERVWDTLWQDATFRDWASIIDPETYMVGDLKEGNEIQFISAANGYGVTSLVKKVIVGEFLLLNHSADTQDKLRALSLKVQGGDIQASLDYMRQMSGVLETGA